MRRVTLLALALLAGCGREKSFDERYAEAEQRISASAAAIDREIVAEPSAAASE